MRPGESRNVVWLTLQFLMRHAFMLWLGYRAKGLRNIPRSGGGLVLINHQSFLDPLLAGVPLGRPISFLARDTLFPVPVVGWVLRNTYVMPINRDAASTASIRMALQRMEEGYLVGIFPEGTRSEDGSVGEFKPGFVSLIRRSNGPVFPVGIAGAHEAMPRRRAGLFPRRVQVVFGPPIPREVLEPLCQKGREAELVELTHQAVQACHAAAEQARK